ncbi:MAG TPA: hypothetical protein VG408_06290, partial [Actinomycetota bacterium]|nr:hypothetical protein [Actinomycetota bacterium]
MLWLALLGSLAAAVVFWGRSRSATRDASAEREALLEAQAAADLESLRADVRRLSEQVAADAG